MSDKETFYMLCHLIEDVIPKDYYTNMMSLTADINILILFINERFPKLIPHLRKLHFDLPMVLVEPFITVFTTNRNDITDIIIDSVLIDGSRVYFKVIMIFFQYFSETILEMQEFRRTQ